MKHGRIISRSLVLLLLFSACFFAAHSLRASSPIGAVVQTWWFDSASKELVVRLSNTSQKGITAFDLAVTERFTDSTTEFADNATDYLPLMASAQIYQGLRNKYGDGTFPGGTTRDIRIPLQKELRDASVVLDVVIYADQTAESSNDQALLHLIAMRQGDILALRQANKVITDALSSANPREAASKELRRLADVSQGERGALDDPNSQTQRALRRSIADVEQADDLSGVIKDNEARIAFYSSHSQPWTVQP